MATEFCSRTRSLIQRFRRRASLIISTNTRHARLGLFSNKSTVGLFRHEDESLSPYFIEHVTIYPGRYRVRTSLWSFTWDKGEVLPGRGIEAARLSVVQLTGDGRGGQHPSYVLGYFDAPSMDSQTHELITWSTTMN